MMLLVIKGYNQALQQIDDIILTIYKNQIDQYINSNQYNLKKNNLFKFHEV